MRSDFQARLSDTVGIWIPGPRIEADQARWFSGLPLSAHYLGFSHHLRQDSRARLQLLDGLGHELDIPLVAVGDVHYHVRGRRALHDVLTAIRLKTTIDQVGRRDLQQRGAASSAAVHLAQVVFAAAARSERSPSRAAAASLSPICTMSIPKNSSPQG